MIIFVWKKSSSVVSYSMTFADMPHLWQTLHWLAPPLCIKQQEKHQSDFDTWHVKRDMLQMAHKGRGDILKKLQVPISYGLRGKLFLKILRKRMSELQNQWIYQSQICLYDSSGFTMVTDIQNVPIKPSAARVNFWSEQMHFFHLSQMAKILSSFTKLWVVTFFWAG